MSRLVGWGEVKLALRLMAKQPVLSATIVLALATGIAVATTGFTLRDAMLNSVLPYASGDRFVRLHLVDRDSGRRPLDLERYRLFLDKATTLEHLGAASGRPFTIELPSGEVEYAGGAGVTPRSMRLVEASPLLGRILIESDGRPGAEPVALIRESFWKRRHDSDTQIVGKTLFIGGVQRTIVGVMPDTFRFPASSELWIPLDDDTLGGSAARAADGVNVFGVMKAGVDLDAVNAELAQLSASLPPPDGVDSTSGLRVRVSPYTGDSDQTGVAMSAVVAVLVLLLLVVASNVATLVLARTWARASELAVRSALGAGRGRIVVQLFAEVLVLGTIAAVIGLAVALAVLELMSQTMMPLPFWVSFDPNPRIMAFVVLLTLMVSAVSGLWPALRVTRYDLRDTLHAGRGSVFGGFGRFGASLLIVEIALSVALLNGAVSIARAFNGLNGDVPALPRREVLTAQLGRIADPATRDQVVAAVSRLPGVVAAGASSHLPRLFASPSRVSVEDRDEAARPAPSQAVGQGFLEAIGAQPVAGRLFVAADFGEGAAPVAVVNEPFVRKFLGGGNAVGRRIRIEGGKPEWREVVGVVGDLGMSVGDPEMVGGFYVPVRDERLWYLAVRTTGDPMTFVAPLRKAVAGVNPDLQLQEFLALEDVGFDERAFLVAIASALTVMGGVALALSIVGIYALLSFMVTRRTREIGIRVALGATGRQVLRSVVGGAAVYLAIGGALGSALGIAFVGLRSWILISIPEPGFWMPATIVLTLAVAGGTACWVPARRALRIRPSEALASE